jgi:AraC-like DNA-binding protein
MAKTPPAAVATASPAMPAAMASFAPPRPDHGPADGAPGPDALLRNLGESKTTRGRVEALLIPRLHTGDLAMDDIAEALGLSRQTLYRRLKAENASFDQVLDALRRKMAET